MPGAGLAHARWPCRTRGSEAAACVGTSSAKDTCGGGYAMLPSWNSIRSFPSPGRLRSPSRTEFLDGTMRGRADRPRSTSAVLPASTPGKCSAWSRTLRGWTNARQSGLIPRPANLRAVTADGSESTVSPPKPNAVGKPTKICWRCTRRVSANRRPATWTVTSAPGFSRSHGKCSERCFDVSFRNNSNAHAGMSPRGLPKSSAKAALPSNQSHGSRYGRTFPFSPVSYSAIIWP